MKILVFADRENTAIRKRLIAAVGSAISKKNLISAGTLRGLYRILKKLPKKFQIAVLAASDQSRISDFISLKTFLENVPLILVLPDDKPETVALAHQLRPRFVTYVDDDFDAITAVIEKMIQNNHKNS